MLRDARRHLRRTSAIQFALPLVAAEAEFARSEGISTALARSWSARWLGWKWRGAALPVARPLARARIEAERAVAARNGARSEPEDASARTAALCQEAEAMATTTPADRAHHALVQAERARLLWADEVGAWVNAVAACRAMNEPFAVACALLRNAEALAGEGDTEAAVTAAGEGLGLAFALGATPLSQEIAALIPRARLRVASDPDGSAAPAGEGMPVELDRWV